MMDRGFLYCAAACTIAVLPGRAESGESPPRRQQGGPAVCELKIEGQAIEKLLLYAPDAVSDNNKEIDRPGASVRLPAGRYGLNTVTLRGGFYSSPTGSFDYFTLSPGVPHVLRVGAPLKPVVEVSRVGRLLNLDYRLVDASGRSYTPKDRSKPPRFTVHQDGKLIADCPFEYG
jgi:hypothetical protein